MNGGRQEVDLFMMHYENMIHNLPSEDIASLDTQITEQCESAIIGLQQLSFLQLETKLYVNRITIIYNQISVKDSIICAT